jgi:hypothetical protein
VRLVEREDALGLPRREGLVADEGDGVIACESVSAVTLMEDPDDSHATLPDTHEGIGISFMFHK